MIVLDSSAVLAVLLEEQQGEAALERIKSASPLLMSAVNVLECVMRLAPRPETDRTAILDRMLVGLPVQIIAIDEPQLRLARAGSLLTEKDVIPQV